MESFEQCYSAVDAMLREKVVETTYNLFISGIKPVSFSEGIATLSVSSEFQRGVVEERYSEMIKEGFHSVLGFSVELKIISRDQQPKPDTTPLEETSRFLYGDYSYTFDNFIVGSNNRFAHAAAQAVAANPSGAYNPLFIYGASGLGKTHLLMAIKNDIEHSRPEMNTVYVEGERFTNELIIAIGQGNTASFHDKYRSADVLLVDDIQFIGGKESTQEEFFHTFNELYKSGKQIVLASDRPPKEIKSLEERLRTRFEWGLLADIQPPDIETRISILHRKADMLGLELPDDVAQFIAEKIKDNIRQLEGTIKKLNAYKLIDGETPNLINTQDAIKDILMEHRPLPVTIERIIDEVSRTFDVSSEDMRSTRRDSNITSARQVAMYVIREVTGMTMEDIGAEFSNRNHSTVTHSLKKVSKQMSIDSRLRETIDDIIKNAKG
ncbi:MAG: chromosomal replication initiator protein DnaA [Ruminococcaceae bacterium]|nr:chromosomal replication initiator protein DnaA [Oscillospiraceae bacterium]